MALLDKDGLSYFWSKIKTKLNGKANVSHTHAIADVTNLQTSLDSKSDTGHTHDDRYYTESEVNSKLANYVTFDNNGSETMKIQWHGADWTKSGVSHVACWNNNGSLIHTVPVDQFADASHSHSLLTEVKHATYQVSIDSYSQDERYDYLLPTIDQVGKFCVYNFTSGSVTYNSSSTRPLFGVSLPNGGTYKVIHSFGFLTVKSKYSTSSMSFSKTDPNTWVTGSDVGGNKGQTATVTGIATIILMRVA